MIALEQRKYHCGEIYVTNNNYRVMLECKFCDKQFGAYDKFLKHIFLDHFDNIDHEDSTTESLDFDDMEILKALENKEYSADNDDDITTEIMESICDTNGEKESDFAETTENLSTEMSTIASEVDKQTTNDAQQNETVEQSSVSSNTDFRPVVVKYRQRCNGEERKYKCKFCNTTFANVFILRNHEQRHSNNKPFPCSQCPKGFFSRTELNTHIRWHTGERPFVCTYCGKCYTTNGALNSHEKRHLGKRTYKCDQCEKTFYEGVHLRQHIVVHTRERKYTCNQCQGKFTRSSALKTHMKLHENALRYKCSICNMRFNQRPTLIWHERSKHAIVRGSTETSNFAVTKSSVEKIDNGYAEYEQKSCDIDLEDNEVDVTVDAVESLETLENADNEYVAFINS